MRRLLITLAPLFLLIACGPGAVGEACQGGAAENDCVEGAVCTLEPSEEAAPPDEPNNESFVCRQICIAYRRTRLFLPAFQIMACSGP